MSKPNGLVSKAVQRAIMATLNDYRGGADDSISRKALLFAIRYQLPGIPGLNDRKMRANIEALRRTHPDGHFICSWLSGGYSLATCRAHMIESMKSEHNRNVSGFKRERAQLQAAEERWPDELGTGVGEQLEMWE